MKKKAYGPPSRGVANEVRADPDFRKLLSLCKSGRRFYAEAAEGSLDSRQSLALQKVELQRAVLALELQRWGEGAGWSLDPLIPLVRSARYEDQRILRLCERMDQETILAYEVARARSAPGLWRALLERHLTTVLEGRAHHAALLKMSS